MAPARERFDGADATAGNKRDTREIARLVVFGLALVLLIAFVAGNTNNVPVNFVFFHHSSSLIWIILVSAVLGVLVDRLIIVLRRRRKSQE